MLVEIKGKSVTIPKDFSRHVEVDRRENVVHHYDGIEEGSKNFLELAKAASSSSERRKPDPNRKFGSKPA